MFQTCFICHSSTDAKEAMGLALAMEAKGRKCWISPRNLPAGSDYAHEIVDGIRHCDAFLILLTNQAASSTHIHRELELASELGKRIIPIRVPGVVLGNSMDYLLKTLHWIDVTPSDLWSSPEVIVERVFQGKSLGPSVAIRPTKEPKAAPSYRTALILAVLACIVAASAWWGWEKWGPFPSTTPKLATTQPVVPSQNDGHTEPLKATVVPDAEVSDQAPAPAAKAIPSDWTCVTIAGRYRIEWAMTFMVDGTTLKGSGHKSTINGIKAGRKERITTLEISGTMESNHWQGTYVEDAQVNKPVIGTFEGTFSDDFRSFEGFIFSNGVSNKGVFNGASR